MGNALKDFSVGNMRETELYEVVYDFSVDYDSIDVDDFMSISWKIMIQSNF